MPTRKLIASTVVAIAALLTTWVTTGSWDQEETTVLIGIASGFVVSYLIPNNPDNPAS